MGSWKPHLRATGRHLPFGITQCYLPPDTSERAPSNPSHAGWYSIYLPRRDGRLSWPSWLDSAPAGSRTSDLSITNPTPNRCTAKTTSGSGNVVEYISKVVPRRARLVPRWVSFHGHNVSQLVIPPWIDGMTTDRWLFYRPPPSAAKKTASSA